MVRCKGDVLEALILLPLREQYLDLKMVSLRAYIA
jgi:hypothetical protein